MVKSITVACRGFSEANLDQFHILQGDLKALPEKEYQALKSEITTEGFSFPINVWNDQGKLWVLDGTQRIITLRRMVEEGWGVPALPYSVTDAEDIQQAKRKLLAAASQYGKPTEKGLLEFLKDVKIEPLRLASNFPLSNIVMPKFVESYLRFTDTGGPAKKDPDETPEPPTNSKVKPGDVFTLGRHKLLCGDSRNPEHIADLMKDDRADMVWTDPPYNVAYVGKTADALTIQNDKMSDIDFYDFLLTAYQNMLKFTRPGGAIYVAHADSEGLNFRQAMVDGGWLMKQCLIWVKQTLVMGRQDYHWKHEPILYGWAPGGSHHWYTDRKQTTVLEFNRPQKSAEHPTMKPVDLIAYCIANSCPQGGMVLDVFGGSGSTLMACETGGRSARLIELDPRYCQVILERWAKFTGLDPVRSDNMPLSAIAPLQ